MQRIPGDSLEGLSVVHERPPSMADDFAQGTTQDEVSSAECCLQARFASDLAIELSLRFFMWMRHMDRSACVLGPSGCTEPTFAFHAKLKLQPSWVGDVPEIHAAIFSA